MRESNADISVVICTRNRAESLRETLSCLARADKPGLRCEVVVVDNNSSDHTAEVASTAIPGLPVHYLTEAAAGKSHAINRALTSAPLGGVIALLDDDMSPAANWFGAVKAVCDRWPDHDLFTGSSHAIWPGQPVPAWCLDSQLRGWAYSVARVAKERPLVPGRWFSGNHFWFRSRVLRDGRRFETGRVDLKTHIEISEPLFMLQLLEEGRTGIMAPDVVCGHRIQPELLQLEVIRTRAGRCGRGFAEARLRPYRHSVHQARQFRNHPLLARGFCLLRLAKWWLLRATARFRRVPARRTACSLQADLEIAYYRELLGIASRQPEYQPSFFRKDRDTG